MEAKTYHLVCINIVNSQ